MGWTRSSTPRLARGVRLRWDPGRGRHLLLLPERVVVLNETAGAILELCDGERPVSDVVREMEARYGARGIESDVLEFLERMNEEGWIT
ncbi:pyrroloquinoline quinone biosynthesis peptide chaperone PqqD [Limnochorda pilosa]|uniref:Pyrroloquinoline quinone biosynthesis protein PqqD n=1 Tax=Limnochorda pilosa TaxID=1555112 RepID=A0A0K2SIS8_LIMPI|nr:pyrroloquinoline quinone biosynthesis peptide chaperone PqqD [Limnochorda pilosa]BAS26995.1 pyrroloquinoline quinone biosynthesis protein PqqD [Limnochorda pilosa]